MKFEIIFKNLTLDAYKKHLKSKDLIPSRQILKIHIDENFETLKSIGLKNLDDLYEVLKNKKKMEKILTETSVPDSYLKILKREIKSIQPIPIKIKEFNWISIDALKKLNEEKIYNTKELFEFKNKIKNWESIAKRFGNDFQNIKELINLSDLTRVQWVNGTFARILIAISIDSTKKLSKANPKKIFDAIEEKNKELKLYKGKIGLNDVKLCIASAKFLMENTNAS
jgi:hypothetical protein